MSAPPPSTAFALETTDHVRLSARRWDAVGDARAAVVLVHGFAGSSDEPRVVALGEALATSGCIVVTYDARGHAASGGESTLGDHERLDVDAAVDAVGDHGVPIVIVGESMGAIAVLWFVTSDPGRADGIVIVSCPARWRLPLNIRGVLATLLTQTPVGRWLARSLMRIRIARRRRRPPPPIELVKDLQVPVVFVHGRRDPFISPSDAEALFAAAPDPRRLSLVDAMAHSFEPTAVRPIVGAVEWVLRART